MTLLTNWNGYPTTTARIASFEDSSTAKAILEEQSNFIPRGMGKCYGDASLNENVISTLKFNKILEFDEEQGTLKLQSGVTLDRIIKLIVPKGWFLPVVPGTKYITIGGGIASDIHGKNHHSEGSLSRQTLSLSVLTGNGNIEECSKEENSDLFWSTCGGMGLTGLILDVSIKLKKVETSYIKRTRIKANNITEVLDMFDEFSDSTYSVAWIDCLKTKKAFGRSILSLGEHAKRNEISEKIALILHKEPTVGIPFPLPSFTLNRFSIRLFNSFYYGFQKGKKKEDIVHYDPFFFPLDLINNWNLIYGLRGFVQYQFVIPYSGRIELVRIFKRITESGFSSFLAVLKLFGEQDNLISFPMKGYTLALDFRIVKGLFDFLKELDKDVMNAGGRLYLSKDCRMDEEMLKCYPHYDEFIKKMKKFNPNNKFSSLLSRRLNIDLKK